MELPVSTHKRPKESTSTEGGEYTFLFFINRKIKLIRLFDLRCKITKHLLFTNHTLQKKT